VSDSDFDADENSFGWRGRVLLVVVAFSVVVAPVVIVWRPPMLSDVDALFAFSMFSAVLVAAVAVWAAVRG
jgi:hypothetical protein